MTRFWSRFTFRRLDVGVKQLYFLSLVHRAFRALVTAAWDCLRSEHYPHFGLLLDFDVDNSVVEVLLYFHEDTETLLRGEHYQILLILGKLENVALLVLVVYKWASYAVDEAIWPDTVDFLDLENFVYLVFELGSVFLDIGQVEYF